MGSYSQPLGAQNVSLPQLMAAYQTVAMDLEHMLQLQTLSDRLNNVIIE